MPQVDFYTQRIEVDGLPVVASALVSPRALDEAAAILTWMKPRNPRIWPTLIAQGVTVAVIGITELVCDLPEYADLPVKFPAVDWNNTTRGLGATKERPVCSCGEENLLLLPEDKYVGESILVHEFAHTLHLMALREVDKSFDNRLLATYRHAMSRRLWERTYITSPQTPRPHEEYWAEGVQSYFDANKAVHPPDGIHNHVATRQQLQDYDSGLAALIAGVFVN